MNDRKVDELLRQCKELRKADKYREAIDLLTEAIRESTDARLYFSRGLTFDLSDQFEQAIADFTRAIALDPHNAKYYLKRGYVFSCSLKRNKEAIVDFEKVVELDPDNVDAHQQCCLSLLLERMPERAWEHAKAALRLAPTDGLSHFCAGESQMSLQQVSDATESFTRAVELDPEPDHYWASLGRARRKLGSKANLESAVLAYSQAIQRKPGSASHFKSRGRLQLQLGMVEDAIQDLRHALTLNPHEVTKMVINRLLAEATNKSPQM